MRARIFRSRLEFQPWRANHPPFCDSPAPDANLTVPLAYLGGAGAKSNLAASRAGAPQKRLGRTLKSARATIYRLSR